MKKIVKFRNDLKDEQFIYRIQFFSEDMPTYENQNNESIDRVDLFIPTYEKGFNGEYLLRYYTRTYNYNPLTNIFSFTDFSPVITPSSTLIWDDQIVSSIRPIGETIISTGIINQITTLPKSASRYTRYSSNSNFTYTNINNDLINWQFITPTATDPVIINVNHDQLFVNDIEDAPSIIPSINIEINSSALQINDIYILTYSYDYDKQIVTVNYHKSSNLFRDTLSSDAFYSKAFNFDGSAISIAKKTSFQVLNGWSLTNVWHLQKSIINSRTINVSVGEHTTVNLAPISNIQIKSTISHVTPEFSCEKKIELRFRCDGSSLDIYFMNDATLSNVSYDRIDVLIPTYKKDEYGNISKFTYIRNIYGLVNNKIVGTGFAPLNSLDNTIYNVTPSIFPNKETKLFQEDISYQLHELSPSTTVRTMSALRNSFGTSIDTAIAVTVFDEYELDSGSNFAERGIYPTIKITPNFIFSEPTLVITYRYDYDSKLVTITKHNVNAYLSSNSNEIDSPSEVYPFNGNQLVLPEYLTPLSFNLLEGPPTFDKLIPATINSDLSIGTNLYFNINPCFGTYTSKPFLPNNSLFTSERKFKTLSHLFHSYEFVRNGNELELQINEKASAKNRLSADRFDLFIPTYSVGNTTANKLTYQVKSFGIDSATKKLVDSEFNLVTSRDQTLFWHATTTRKIFSSTPTMMFTENSQQLNFGNLNNLTKFRINNMNDYIEISYTSSVITNSTKQLKIFREFGYFDKPLENIDPMFMLVYQYDYVNGYVVVTYHPLDQYMITPSNDYVIESRVYPFNGSLSVTDHVKTINAVISPASLVSDAGFIGYGDITTNGFIRSVVKVGEKTDIDLTPLVGCSVCFV